MNHIYIGDRQLEPDDEPEPCDTCGGSGQVNDGYGYIDCWNCDHDDDPGEPNEDPE